MKLKPSADPKIFEWLRSDSQGISHHLHFLNLRWSPEGVEHDVGIYKQVALRLRQEPDYWKQVILDQNWRYTLVGCVAAMLLEDRSFFQEMRTIFPYTMVSPQVAVILGLLHPDKAIPHFENMLLTADANSNPRAVISAHLVILKLGLKKPVAFDDTAFLDNFDVIMRQYGELAYSVVEHQWAFWQPRVRTL